MRGRLRSGLARLALRARTLLKPAVDAVAGALTVLLLKAVRRTDPDRISAFAGRMMRRLGPWLAEHRTGRANLAAAFPEKSRAEVEEILAGAWENLGRLGAEYAHLDRLADFREQAPGTGRVELSAASIERFLQLRHDGKPALLFSAHLANWELPAVAAAANGLETAILYRRPNIGDVADAIQKIRAVNMGTLISTSGFDAAFRVAAALERGAHVGLLVDQHFSRGVDVTFFGRRCKANPMLARLARRFDCPIHGARVVRLPGNRFRIEVTEAIVPARDAQGRIEVAATMQIVTSVVEGWVREHPEQWLWQHRRWR
jgi:Kdo2-lipid IVA lauroyltransferase/acyltransferase